jgi:hypothetical protein
MLPTYQQLLDAIMDQIKNISFQQQLLAIKNPINWRQKVKEASVVLCNFI